MDAPHPMFSPAYQRPADSILKLWLITVRDHSLAAEARAWRGSGQHALNQSRRMSLFSYAIRPVITAPVSVPRRCRGARWAAMPHDIPAPLIGGPPQDHEGDESSRPGRCHSRCIRRSSDTPPCSSLGQIVEFVRPKVRRDAEIGPSRALASTDEAGPTRCFQLRHLGMPGHEGRHPGIRPGCLSPVAGMVSSSSSSANHSVKLWLLTLAPLSPTHVFPRSCISRSGPGGSTRHSRKHCVQRTVLRVASSARAPRRHRTVRTHDEHQTGTRGGPSGYRKNRGAFSIMR